MYRLLTFYPLVWDVIQKNTKTFPSEGQLRAQIAEILLTTDPNFPAHRQAQALLELLDNQKSSGQ